MAVRPTSPLILNSSQKRKVEPKSEEEPPSAFNCVSVVSLKNKEGKEMFHSLDEILRQREEKRKRKERNMRWMAGLPDQDQDQAQAQDNSTCNKKKSKEDMLWFIRNQK